MTLPRTNWVLFGDRTLSCSRLQGYAIHDYLRREGQPSRLLSPPPFPIKDAPWEPPVHELVARLVGGETVVLDRLKGPRAEALVRELVRRGTPVVFAASDWEPTNTLPTFCTAIVCSSRLLAEHWTALGHDAVVIPEPADFWIPPGAASRPGPGPIRLCWTGHRKNWPTLEPLRELLRRPDFDDFELVTVSNHADADVQWTLAAAETALRSSDVAVVPTRTDEAARYASPNRAVQAMASSKPVVAGRIPAYEDLIVDGVNGYLCDDAEGWRATLVALRDPALRATVGARGYETVRPRFHIDVTGRHWTDRLASLRITSRPASRPERLRLSRIVRASAHARYAQTALERDLGLKGIVVDTAAALTLFPLAPAQTAATARELVPPLAGRVGGGIRRRLAGRAA
ncbi:MAG: hypothetical protein QOG29_986 [Gaiellaceae bacterium]|nr:hypothetical protein [Gaiellaceae bacterium]